MPVEIRELVIQAKLKEGQNKAVGMQQNDELPQQVKGRVSGEITLSTAEVQEMVEKLVKQILAEHALR